MGVFFKLTDPKDFERSLMLTTAAAFLWRQFFPLWSNYVNSLD